jgi:hypothetical protein
MAHKGTALQDPISRGFVWAERVFSRLLAFRYMPPRRPKIIGPLPHISNGVVETVIICSKAMYRGCPKKSITFSIQVRELALPNVGLVFSIFQ